MWARPEFTSWKAWGQSWKSFKQWAVDKWSTEAELPLPTDKLPASLLSIRRFGTSFASYCDLSLFNVYSLIEEVWEVWTQPCESARLFRDLTSFSGEALRQNILRAVHVGSVIPCANIVPELCRLFIYFFSLLLFLILYILGRLVFQEGFCAKPS